jgi:lysophospholipase L1-like esterase
MNHYVISLITAIIFSLIAGETAHAVPIERDVIVYGGTSGGVSAAVQIRRSGKTVTLISPTDHVGGMTTSGLGWTDVGDNAILGGISREFYEAVYAHYQNAAAWDWQSQASFGNAGQGGPAFNNTTEIGSVFEPKVAESIFTTLMTNAGVELTTGLLDRGGANSGVTKIGTKITTIRLEDGREYSAKIFIDATYEGDLLPGAGVTFTVGRESNATYSETFNGIQTDRAVKNQLRADVEPSLISGEPGSGLLPGIQTGPGGNDGDGDNKLQAYCYRMVLTDVAANRVPIGQPPGYDEADYELLFRTIAEGQTGNFFKLDLMPNRKTDSNNNGGISTDFIGMNYGPGWDWTTLSHTERAQLALDHENWQRGLIWTLQNHTRVPQSIRDSYAGWGLPADEFTDNNNWPWQLYIREGRRMISTYVMTQANASGAAVANDSIGLAAYSMDSHNVQRHAVNGEAKNEGDVQMGVGQPFPVSYRAIIPERSECTNLLVPWSLSASHIAFGSIRMEPVFMALSQSAALAASLAIDSDIAVQDLPYSELRPALKAAGQALGDPIFGEPTTIIDSTDSPVIITGTWSPSATTGGYIGSDYLHDENIDQGSKDVFYPLPANTTRTHHIWARWTAHGNRASNVKFDIIHSNGTTTYPIDQRVNGGAWRFIGIHNFSDQGEQGIRISNTDADGYVIADAIGFSPVSPQDDSDDDNISDINEALIGTSPFSSNAQFFSAILANPTILDLYTSDEIYDIEISPSGQSLALVTGDSTIQGQIDGNALRKFFRVTLRPTPSTLVKNLAAGQAQTLVAYGTSLTANGIWLSEIETILDEKYPGLLTVINSGLSGKSSFTGLSLLTSKVLEKNPDTVLIEFAINDAFRYGFGTPQLTVAQAKENLVSMIDQILVHNPDTEIIIQTTNPVWDSPTGSNESAALRPDLEDFYAAYREVATERSLMLIDHNFRWTSLEANDLPAFQTAIPDGIHPTAEAQRAHVLPLIKWKLTGKN